MVSIKDKVGNRSSYDFYDNNLQNTLCYCDDFLYEGVCKTLASFIVFKKPSAKYINLYKTMIYAHCFLAISSILVIM